MTAKRTFRKNRLTLFVILIAISAFSRAQAAYTAPDATIDKIWTLGAVHVIDLDATASMSPPFSCTNWTSTTTGTHRVYINPITDDAAKSQLSEALAAFISGKKIAVSATSCYSTTGWPKVDNLYIVP